MIIVSVAMGLKVLNLMSKGKIENIKLTKQAQK